MTTKPKKPKKTKAPDAPDPIEAAAEQEIAENAAQTAAAEDEIPPMVLEVLKMEKQIASLPLETKTQVRTSFVLMAVVQALADESQAAGRVDENGTPDIVTHDFWMKGVFPILQALAKELPACGVTQLDKIQEAIAHFWTGGPIDDIQPPAEA